MIATVTGPPAGRDQRPGRRAAGPGCSTGRCAWRGRRPVPSCQQLSRLGLPQRVAAAAAGQRLAEDGPAMSRRARRRRRPSAWQPACTVKSPTASRGASIGENCDPEEGGGGDLRRDDDPGAHDRWVVLRDGASRPGRVLPAPCHPRPVPRAAQSKTRRPPPMSDCCPAAAGNSSASLSRGSAYRAVRRASW